MKYSDITALLGEELPGKRSAERVRLLLAIPDDGILRLVLARLKSESHLSTTDLRFALDMLGCGPDVSRHTWLKSRGLQEMRGILGHATLSQLARDYGEALRKVERNKLLPRPERMQILPSVPSPQLDSPFDPPGPLPGGSIASVESRPADQSQVFGIVSPTFGGTVPKQPVMSVAPSSAVKGLVPKDFYAQAHEATHLLLRAWDMFEQLGGNWSRPDVQQDLLLLHALVEEYIQRGQAPTTN